MTKHYKELTFKFTPEYSVHWWRDWYEGRWHENTSIQKTTIKGSKRGYLTEIPTMRGFRLSNYTSMTEIDPMPEDLTQAEAKQLLDKYLSNKENVF